MASDILSARRWEARVKEGETDAETAVMLTGSYARLDLAIRLMDQGLVTPEWFFRELPDLWSGSDPDDTNERFIRIWEDAFARNGGTVYQPGERKRLPRKRYITIWRGQRDGDRLGCAWSLSRRVAERFARGASFRTAIANPVIIETIVPRGTILAYLTGRGEEEVIIDPTILSQTETK